jgi:EAL domain-containing protein (putative c-di-GMP-specific phosphodiesterase class I)
MLNACQDVQGYLFGRPVHARDVAGIIAKDVRKALAEEQPGPARVGTAA